MKWNSFVVIACVTVASLFSSIGAGSIGAQQTTGTPGSPSATTTIDGKQIPPPPPKFGGVIKESAKDSTPWWPPRVVPPKGAPNVLLIMTDDQGYGVSGTFGGVIPTPALDRIAKAGLRYTQSSPFYTIAKLTLMPKSQLGADEEAARYFDVTGNSTPDSTPVGSINRARWASEVASRKARNGSQMRASPAETISSRGARA